MPHLAHTSTSRRTPAEPWRASLTEPFRGATGEGARFALFAALIVVAALCGGSSWPQTWSLLVLRPAAVLLAMTILMLSGPIAWPTLRAPGLLLAALALSVAVQMIPLPPGLWVSLPGHAPFAEAADAAGMAQPWRPITLSLDLTLNSLVALGMPAAVLLSAGALRSDQRAATAGLMVGVATASALLGLFQITLGPGLYLYGSVNFGRPTGLFANINHQAAFLAAIIPVTAAWAVATSRPAPLRLMIAAATGTLLLATILVSGSRGGLALGLVATLCLPLVIGDRVRLPRRVGGLLAVTATTAVLALVAAVWASGRLNGLDRLLGSGADQRVTFLPITLQLLRDYMPFGSGFGTFDLVFRHAEPDGILKLTYFNHAHNDLLELGITGGLPALAVAAAYVTWLMRRGVAAFGAGRRTASAPLARAGVVAAALLLLASLTDYPLRTPLAAMTLALASLWAARQADGGRVALPRANRYGNSTQK